jgi:hypothetical protein
MQVTIKRDVVEKRLTMMNKTMGWLSHQMETDQSYLTRILKDERNPSPVIRQKMMDALGIEKWDELFTIKGD